MAGVVAVRLMKWIDVRLVAVIALCAVAAACLMDARLTSDWAQAEFWLPQLVLATGLAFLFVVQIGMTVLQALSAGLAPGSSDGQEAQGSAMAALAGQLSRQALTLTYADGFVLLASLCAGLLVAYACMKPVKKNYFATKQMALES